jgi:hypothetical protein
MRADRLAAFSATSRKQGLDIFSGAVLAACSNWVDLGCGSYIKAHALSVGVTQADVLYRDAGSRRERQLEKLE